MNKDESSSKNLTTPSLDLASHVLSADLKQSTKPNQNNNNKSCKKNDSTSFLNKSNDCLVQDFDDEEIRSIADRGTNPILKKSNKAKVLFDLNNEGNMDVSSKTSNNPMTSSFCRIGTNFSNRINNTNKQSKWNGKRKNSSSSNLAIPQSSTATSSSTEFTRMNANRLGFPFNDRIQSVFEIVRARFNSRNGSGGDQRRRNNGKKVEKSGEKSSKKKGSLYHAESPKDCTLNKYSDDSTKTLKHQTSDQASDSDICQLCFIQCSLIENPTDPTENHMYNLSSCEHYFCIDCLRLYLKYQIVESRIMVSCPQCTEKMHPNDIYRLLAETQPTITSTTDTTDSLKPNEIKPEPSLTDTPTATCPVLIQKYEEFMLRRVLVTIADTRWCPAPDCTYAVIASGCANCPQLYCMRPNCNTSFCYHCKQTWHPNITCEDAAIQNNQTSIGILLNSINKESAQTATQTSSTATTGSSTASTNKLIRSLLQRSNSHISIGSSQGGGLPTNHKNILASSDLIKEEIKRCPKCQALIVKMDDGSCNHITCAVCGCEFCWLCMKEISDLHYLSPSGCTFWGKKPWSRKKKILWQLGILIGAPVGIALIAGVAIPAILIGLPIWSGRKVYIRYKHMGKHKRNLIVISTVTSTIILAPLVAALAIGIGVPILLAYVYGVVPISLCRSGGCGVTKNNNGGVRFAFDEENADTFNTFNFNNNNATANIFASNSNLPAATVTSISETKKNNLDNSIALAGSSSVKVPISAIESKPTSTTNPNELNLSKSYRKKVTAMNSDTEIQTPVLVTITMANKHHLTTELNNNSFSKNGKPSSKKSSRRRSSSANHKSKSERSNSRQGFLTKEELLRYKKNSFNLKNTAKENCGTVELLKLTKSMTNCSQEPDLIKNPVASECVTGACALSVAMSSNNISDAENNISSSSSSQQLLEICENNSNKMSNFSTSRHIRILTTKDDERKKQLDIVTNPSIGEFSIGVCTMTSRSVSGSNLFDFESKKSRIGLESLNVNDSSENAESINQPQINETSVDRDSASNTAIASSSINTFQLTEKKSTVSENPSVTALAGSIKDNQSVGNISNEEKVSISSININAKARV